MAYILLIQFVVYLYNIIENPRSLNTSIIKIIVILIII